MATPKPSKTDIYVGWIERHPVPHGDTNMKIWATGMMKATVLYAKGCSREERRLNNPQVKRAVDDLIMIPWEERGSPQFFAWLRSTYPGMEARFTKWKARTLTNGTADSDRWQNTALYYATQEELRKVEARLAVLIDQKKCLEQWVEELEELAGSSDIRFGMAQEMAMPTLQIARHIPSTKPAQHLLFIFAHRGGTSMVRSALTSPLMGQVTVQVGQSNLRATFAQREHSADGTAHKGKSDDIRAIISHDLTGLGERHTWPIGVRCHEVGRTITRAVQMSVVDIPDDVDGLKALTTKFQAVSTADHGQNEYTANRGRSTPAEDTARVNEATDRVWTAMEAKGTPEFHAWRTSTYPWMTRAMEKRKLKRAAEKRLGESGMTATNSISVALGDDVSSLDAKKSAVGDRVAIPGGDPSMSATPRPMGTLSGKRKASNVNLDDRPQQTVEGSYDLVATPRILPKTLIFPLNFNSSSLSSFTVVSTVYSEY
ncbi:uncharacterized protein B0H18DRAFT_959750 [Fomitopsis serialis]|uniref:uncharacterized protein n=1 Tax=Fomitopsis serialis TaxID=139415 RepID=UPI002007D5F2|nr:uncharacterized protein B0H18DRAFT_959750 [Neoantrodia serialis]KAH9914581.1 hypothetical protein B0H18DRAFT_959750 [Neoantrodia serialis]